MLQFRFCMLAACPFPANHGTPGSIREMSEGIAGLTPDLGAPYTALESSRPLTRLSLPARSSVHPAYSMGPLT